MAHDFRVDKCIALKLFYTHLASHTYSHEVVDICFLILTLTWVL